MEVYIDDMLVKSLKEKVHVTHLKNCFERVNLHNIKLNPAKCRFAVVLGEFLGYLVTYRGIEANPKRIDALIQMASPKNEMGSAKIDRKSRGTQLFYILINRQMSTLLRHVEREEKVRVVRGVRKSFPKAT